MRRGKGYSVNVPLRDGIRDDSFHSIFKPVSYRVLCYLTLGRQQHHRALPAWSYCFADGRRLTCRGQAGRV